MIKDKKSYFQGKIRGLREALSIVDKDDYATRQHLLVRITEYEEILNGPWKE